MAEQDGACGLGLFVNEGTARHINPACVMVMESAVAARREIERGREGKKNGRR